MSDGAICHYCQQDPCVCEASKLRAALSRHRAAWLVEDSVALLRRARDIVQLEGSGELKYALAGLISDAEYVQRTLLARAEGGQE